MKKKADCCVPDFSSIAGTSVKEANEKLRISVNQ